MKCHGSGRSPADTVGTQVNTSVILVGATSTCKHHKYKVTTNHWYQSIKRVKNELTNHGNTCI